jgi:macrolide-specific efflux system membrane fusion protein
MISCLKERPWLNGTLAVLCVVAIVVAYTSVGQASPSSGQSTRTATVQQGVVQSTVSGSGNVEPSSELNVGFKTSGTVTRIYVKQGQHVSKGQLLATVDPQSAEVTLEQAKASLQSAEANLTEAEEGETSSPSTQASPSGGAASGGGSTQSSGGSPSGTSTSPATQEANIASARAAVKSDQLTVQSDEQAVQNTKLYAPEDGTIATLSGEVGETVSAIGTSKASSATASSSSTAGESAGAGSSGATGGSSGASTGASSGATGSSSSSTSPFIVLTNLSSMQVVVPLSESEVESVRVGQTATVAIEALSGHKVAAHVLSIASLPASSSSGVVSYDVTFRLDQLETGVKAGMSATAEVVVTQAEGLNVPTSAISGGTVTVVQGAEHVARAVTTGLAGNTSTIILSGLKVGEKVVLPTPTTAGTGSAARSAAAASPAARVHPADGIAADSRPAFRRAAATGTRAPAGRARAERAAHRPAPGRPSATTGDPRAQGRQDLRARADQGPRPA